MQEQTSQTSTERYGKWGTAMSILVAVAFVALCDLAAYVYIQNQAISTESEVTSMEAWVGLQQLEEPVDILLLGDSACRVNLPPGAFADRLGGSVINLGNTAQTSMLTDAWMLKYYIDRFGPPKAVVVMRTSVGYAVNHNMEFMANPPLPWGYWDRFGLSPVWKPGETGTLFFTKYGVLYSDADVLSARLVRFWDLFRYSVTPRKPGHDYTTTIDQPKVPMDIGSRMPAFYFDKFYATPDSTNAVSYLADLARQYRFQLYFTLQAEWDEAVNAGLRTAHIAAEKEFLGKHTDPTYVHVVDQIPKTLFTNSQMQSPDHLWKGAEKIYAEEIVNGIVAVQNQLTAAQATEMKVIAVSFDKPSYQIGDMPIVTVEVAATENNGAIGLSGRVVVLAKPAGEIDGNWRARAPAVPLSGGDDPQIRLQLKLTAGSLNNSGIYDAVVFLRQDVGTLSHETRFEVRNAFKVAGN